MYVKYIKKVFIILIDQKYTAPLCGMYRTFCPANLGSEVILHDQYIR
jgi:hypothetical protein